MKERKTKKEDKANGETRLRSREQHNIKDAAPNEPKLGEGG